MDVKRPERILLVAIAGLLLGSSRAPLVPPDKSLTPGQYRAMGVPVVEERWTGADHEAALHALRGLSREALPRAGSERSGQIFGRLVESLHAWLEFKAVHGDGPPSDAAASDPLSASTLYGRSARDDLFFDRELLELLTATAQHILDQLDALAEEPAARLDSGTSEQTQELLELQRATRPQLREDLGTLLVVTLAGLVEIGELPASRPGTRLALRDALVALAPRALRHLSGPRADALRDALRTMAAAPWNQAIRTDIEQLATTEVPAAP